MRYCSRSRCFLTDPRTKHISVPPRHMTKSYASDFQHDITALQIQDKTSNTIGIQLPEYNTTAEDTCLGTDYKKMPTGKEKSIDPHKHTGPGPPPGSS